MERKNSYSPITPRPLPPSGERPLAITLLRGNGEESRHRVHALVVDAKGIVQKQWGDPSLRFFPRSSVKMIQAVAWASADHPLPINLTDAELSIACGSHEGEPVHVAVVSEWLKKLGLSEKDLDCGAHDPYSRQSARELWRQGEAPCQLHNNCSGKHCGFLTACLAAGWPTLGYTNYDHPLQASVRKTLGIFWGENLGQAVWGIDGCGIPSYSVSLSALALSMARLSDPKGLSSQIQKAVGRLNEAVAARPEMIGGSESFSSKVIIETKGKVLAKMGAEGVYGVWIPAQGWGIAIKCEDGSTRGSEAAVAAILGELGYELGFYSPKVKRWSGEVVGQIICE